MIPARVVLVANAASLRVSGFRGALNERGFPEVELVPWRELLRERVDLGEFLTPGTLVRIESAGEDQEVERLLLARGAELPDESFKAPRLSRARVSALQEDPARILAPRQFYLGLRAALGDIGTLLAAHPRSSAMNAPRAIEAMLDKERTAAILADAGVATPAPLGKPASFDELLAAMASAGCRRVFVKLANGSSGSGVVAYATDGKRHLALTSAEIAGPALYNSTRLHRYSTLAEVRLLFDTLCREGVIVQRWIPKALLGSRPFDVRVVVVAGRCRHVVVRSSNGPVTNLQIGGANRRGDLAAARARVGETGWGEGLDECRRAVGAFPGTLYGGVDLVFPEHPGPAKVLEVNAFGDWLKRDLHEGENPWEAELTALRAVGVA